MRTYCWLLVALKIASGYKIITKSMIHSPSDLWYEPVQLKTKEEVTAVEAQVKTTTTELPYEHAARNAPLYEDESAVEEEESEAEEENEEDEEDLMTTTEPYLDSDFNNFTTIATPTEAPLGRTKLFQVGRLWERTSTDIWTVLSAAFGCIWSGVGLDCFTYKVVPMFKSMMGYQQFNQPLFFLPRHLTEENEIEGRIRRRHTGLKLLKAAVLGLVGLKALILPVLVGLALVSGKALFISFLSALLTAATAWTTAKSADRRVETDAQTPNYYM